MWMMAAVAHATEIGTRRTFGLGVQLGGPTGITGKVYVNGRKNAIDFLLGGAYYDDDFDGWNSTWAHVSYHWALAELASGDGVSIPFRIGIGGFVSSRYYPHVDYGDVVFGARVPFGLDFDLDAAPVQFWVEVAVDVTVLPPLGVGADAGIGFRYYF